MAMDFCSGPGRVMLPGFQSSVNGTCILFLFAGANINTQGKYAIAMIMTFVMAFSNEGFAFGRKRILTSHIKSTVKVATECFLYGTQMVVAYWLMLLVMTYEAGIFTMLILGLVSGHFTFQMIENRSKKHNEDPLIVSSGTPCCGGSNQ